jgi:hypothetical protein
MAKAHLVRPDGTTVNIEGTPEEVAALVERLSTTSEPDRKRRTASRTRRPAKSGAGARAPRRTGPQDLIAALAQQDFFKSKRTLGDVQAKLEEAGHIYAMTSLSSPMLRLTRKKVLRRLKDKDGWVYVV